MITSKKIADHVRVPVSAERTDRMWRRLDAQMDRRRRPSRIMMATGGLVAAAAIAVVGIGLRMPAKAPIEIARDEAKTSEEGVRLPDGSRLSPIADAKTSVLVASREIIRVRLERGAAVLDVVRDERRTFVLEAGAARVHADGARFRAEVGEAPLLSLTVETGAVVVKSADGDEMASLQAGQSWTLRPAPPTPKAPEPTPVRPAPRPAPSTRTPDVEVPPSAQSLFAQADESRLAGDPAGAAKNLERLCTSFPGDARAGVAAFQLGRLRLNELGDPAAAARWLRVALAHPSAGAYREDAAADLVEALDRAGNTAECQSARDAFVAGHPQSRRVAAVSRRCAPR